MISPPNTSERTMKTVVGRATIRIQIPEIVLRNRVGAAVVSVGKSRTDTPCRWTSIRRIAPLPLGTCRIGADQDIDVEARSRWGRIRKSQSLLTDEEVSLISLLLCGGTPDRPRLRDRQGPAGLHGLHRRVGSRPHLSNAWRARQSALVLTAPRHRPRYSP
jgi:hypothetical protein